MEKSQIIKLNQVVKNFRETGSFDEALEEFGKLTPNEFVDYEKHHCADNDCTWVLWTISETWGFECHWAGLARMSIDELRSLKEANPGTDITTPGELTPDLPLSRHPLWAFGH